MTICILSSKMGTPQHLIVDGNSDVFSWVGEPPKTAWIHGTRDTLMSLDVLSDLYKIDVRSLFPEEHERAFRVLGSSGSPGIPWHLAISPERFRGSLRCIIRDLQKVLEDHNGSGYGQTFMDERKFILDLSESHVDRDRILEHMAHETNRTVRSSLRSFLPKNDSHRAPEVEYSQVATHTGRLTVTAGPQILTIPARCRDIMASRFNEGEVIQVDFVSIEPRFARLDMGETSEIDVYQEICDSILGGKIKRSVVKIAVLCALYGASTVKLQGLLGDDFDARDIVRKLREHFGVGPLGVRLRAELSETGSIINRFGRKINVERTATNVLINNYIQSSSVDVTLLGFMGLMDRLQGMGLETVPIFLIHDALILDVPPREGRLVREEVARGVDMPNLGNFPLKVDVIS